jgi:hypothetical protein
VCSSDLSFVGYDGKRFAVLFAKTFWSWTKRLRRGRGSGFGQW